MNRLTAAARTVAGSFLALIAAGSFALAAPASAEPSVKAIMDTKSASDRLKGQIDSFTGQWRRGIDNLSRSTSSGELTSRSNSLLNKLVHFDSSACMTRDDAVRLRDYLKDSAERQGIVTEAPRSTSVLTFKIDSTLLTCDNGHMTGGLVLYDVKFVTVTRH